MKNTNTIKAMLILIMIVSFSHILLASSNIVTKNYTLKEFSTLKVSSAFQVEFIHSNENKVSIEIDEDVVKNLSVENNENILTIKLKDCMNCRTHTLKAKIYGNSLSNIFISGASSFTSNYVFTDKNIKLNSSGASKIEIAITTENLNIDASGASKVVVKGSAANQTIVASGASNYNGKDCKSNNVDVVASGASKVLIDCKNVLNANASGASSVKYTLEPKSVKGGSSGASSVGLN